MPAQGRAGPFEPLGFEPVSCLESARSCVHPLGPLVLPRERYGGKIGPEPLSASDEVAPSRPRGGNAVSLPLETLVAQIAQELSLPPERLVREGITTYLQQALREVNAEILAIGGKYGVRSVEEMDALYRQGLVEESTSWEDFQKLDHLTARREQIRRLLQALA